MLKGISEAIKRAKIELEEYEKEWDKLDSTGQAVKQKILTDKMNDLRQDIEGMEFTINQMQ